MLQDAGYLLPADAKHLAGMVDDRLARGVDEIRRQRQALNAAVDIGHEIEDGISVRLRERNLSFGRISQDLTDRGVPVSERSNSRPRNQV